MKNCLALILASVVLLSAHAAFASQPVGGAATAEPGKFELSGGYFYSKDKWESSTISPDFKFEANTYYAQLAYGLYKGWDVYLRGGLSDSKSDGNLDVRNNGNPFGGFGFHGQFGEYKPWHLGFGPVGNFTYYGNWSSPGSSTIGGVPVNGRISLTDHYSASIGIGIKWTPIRQFTFFAGPFYFYESAKLKYAVSGTGVSRSDYDYLKTKTPFGPRFGVVCRLTDRVQLTIEGQYRNYLSGGASIGFGF